MSNTTHGAKPGQDTFNEKAPGACGSKGLTTDTTNNLDFATAGDQGEALANQIAHLALAGHVVHHEQRGYFTVCKDGMTRYCKDFKELQAFARQLGVNRE